MGRRSAKHGRAGLLAGLFACLLCACGQGEAEPVTIEREPYERLVYETVEVKRGDLRPTLVLTLTAEGFERISYGAANEGLELERLYVTVGDRVKKGDLLVSFQSGSIQETIAAYGEQIEQNRLLLEHYERLMGIGELDYSRDIQMLKEDIEIAGLYVEEAKEKLERCQIRAKRSGTVTEVDEYLKRGMFVPGEQLITEVCGSGNYSAARPETYEFSVGEVYEATDGVLSYEFEVAKVKKREVVFRPLSDMSGITEEDKLTMTIKKPLQRDVVYVESSAVKKGEEGTFVYVVDSDGFRTAVFVETGDRVDSYLVITDGLSGGEKVAVN